MGTGRNLPTRNPCPWQVRWVVHRDSDGLSFLCHQLRVLLNPHYLSQPSPLVRRNPVSLRLLQSPRRNIQRTTLPKKHAALSTPFRSYKSIDKGGRRRLILYHCCQSAPKAPSAATLRTNWRKDAYRSLAGLACVLSQ